MGVDDVWLTGEPLDSLFPVDCFKILANFYRVFMWRPCCSLFSVCNFIIAWVRLNARQLDLYVGFSVGISQCVG